MTYFSRKLTLLQPENENFHIAQVMIGYKKKQPGTDWPQNRAIAAILGLANFDSEALNNVKDVV